MGSEDLVRIRNTWQEVDICNIAWEEVDYWNKNCPVNTQVLYWDKFAGMNYSGLPTFITRTLGKAFVNPRGHAVVRVRGLNKSAHLYQLGFPEGGKSLSDQGWVDLGGGHFLDIKKVERL